MSHIPGTMGQIGTYGTYRPADKAEKIATGGASQLLTPIPISRSYYLFMNTSSNVMWLEFGSARAYATMSGGVITGVTILNGGFGFTAPPVVEFEGGAGYSNQVSVGPSGAGLPGYAAPSNSPNNADGRPAQAHCVLTSGVVTSIVIEDSGAGYTFTPYVSIRNAHSDRYGCADPYYSSVNSGVQIAAGGSYSRANGTIDCNQISVWCATTGSTYFFEWMQ